MGVDEFDAVPAMARPKGKQSPDLRYLPHASLTASRSTIFAMRAPTRP
jgi:hypothetical protein